MKFGVARRTAVAVTAALVPISAVACTAGGSSSTAEQRTLKIEYGSFSDLDPANSTYGIWIDQGALLEGLVIENSTRTGVEPGIADRTESSSDGLTYTFHLRPGVKWSDGQPVVADDFVFSLKHLLAPRSADAQPSSAELGIGIAGAADYAAGDTKDFSSVGIKAVDASTVQYTLDAPNPDFLVQLAAPPMLPVPEHTLKAHPNDWQKPANWVGDGPYTLSAWVQNSSMTLKKNAKYWDAKNVKLDTVQIHLVTPGTESTLAYDNNEVDVVPLPQTDLKRYQSGSLKSQVHEVKAGQMSYMGMIPSRNPVLNDVRIRKAISMGIDRAALAAVTPGGSVGSLLVPSAAPGWNANDGVKDDVATAKQLLAQAGYPDGKGLPTIHILAASGNTTPVTVIADSLKTNLGINAVPDLVEIGVYVSKRKSLQPKDYVGFYYGSFGGLPSWRYWTTTWITTTDISRLSLSADDYAAYSKADPAAAAQILTDKSNAMAQKFAEDLKVAGTTASPDEANTLYKKAALDREATYYYLPLLYTDNYWLVKPQVKGVAPRIGYEFGIYLKHVSIS